MSLKRKNLARLAGDRDIRSEALSILEGLRQEQIAPDVSPAEIERNRRLVQGTIDVTPVAPYNTALGAEVQGLGIDGAFKPDSTIRLHTQYANTGDTVLLPEVAGYGIQPTGLATEYLSPATAQSMYDSWAKLQQATAQQLNRKPQDTVDHFNRAIAEYYGQQALRLAGARPVADADRSYNVLHHRNANHPNSTLGTDRLIETQRTLMGQDVGMPAGDYRYYNPLGGVTVGDMQVATHDRGESPLNAVVRLQALKGSKMTPQQEESFSKNLQAAAEGASDIDKVLQIMESKGQLPQLVRGEIKRYQNRPDTGMRAGKMTSDAPFMGQENFNDQHRYQHVLYGLQDESTQGSVPGVAPAAYINVDSSAARRFMAEHADQMRLRTTGYKPDGSAYVMANLGQLLKEGVAENVVEAHPIVMQLL